MRKKAVFLDLNGTLVSPVQVEKLDQLQDIPGAIEAVGLLVEHGFIAPVITVQSRIARGFFTEIQFQEWFDSLRSRWARSGSHLLEVYICPHRFHSGCSCAKPQNQLYLQAAAEHNIDVAKSYVIGDTASDVYAAKGIGGKGCLVLTGWGQASLADCEQDADFVGEDVLAVARQIVAAGIC